MSVNKVSTSETCTGRGKNYLVCEIFGSVNVQISCIGGVSGGVSNLSRNLEKVKIKAEVS